MGSSECVNTGTLAKDSRVGILSKTGSDANSAAIRLSRHITKKDIVLTCSYGGWHDWYVGITSRKSGVPKKITQLTKNFIRNDQKNK